MRGDLADRGAAGRRGAVQLGEGLGELLGGDRLAGAARVTADKWDHPYSREQAAFPAAFVREHKFWPAVSRIDNVFGDRNLVCSCVGMDAYE